MKSIRPSVPPTYTVVAAAAVLVLAMLTTTGTQAFSPTIGSTTSSSTTAFVSSRRQSSLPSSASSSTTTTALFGATTVEAPTRERTSETTDGSRRRRRKSSDYDDNSVDDDDNNAEYPDLEYLQDMQVSRELDDPFHILLLGSTFDKPKITVTYVSGSLEYVLNMPITEAKELSTFAYQEGMACLGTWSREECLSLGKQLQIRDIVCRVVPYTEGGQRGWQAKDANDSNNMNQDAYRSA